MRQPAQQRTGPTSLSDHYYPLSDAVNIVLLKNAEIEYETI